MTASALAEELSRQTGDLFCIGFPMVLSRSLGCQIYQMHRGFAFTGLALSRFAVAVLRLPFNCTQILTKNNLQTHRFSESLSIG